MYSPFIYEVRSVKSPKCGLFLTIYSESFTYSHRIAFLQALVNLHLSAEKNFFEETFMPLRRRAANRPA